MKTLLLILLLATSVFAQSVKEGKAITQWQVVAEGPIVKSSIAANTIRRSGDVIKVWARFKLPEGSSSLIPTTDFGEVRAYTILSCPTNEVRPMTMIVYDREGNFVAAKESMKEAIGWQRKGTIGYAIFEYFCERPMNPLTSAPKLKPSP